MCTKNYKMLMKESKTTYVSGVVSMHGLEVKSLACHCSQNCSVISRQSLSNPSRTQADFKI
jgi:hypothetical protein